MKASGLTWYWKRLMAMNLSEIGDRFILMMRKKWWKLITPKHKPSRAKVVLDSNLLIFFSPILEQDRAKILEEAAHYMEHKWLFFSLEKTEKEIDWHFDPYYEISAPKKFSFDINHRLENEVGNIKNIWEKNRHHHLTILSSAYHLTKDERYAKETRDQLKSWILQNPYLIGVNWTHPLEHGVRLIAWVYIASALKSSKYYDEIFGTEGFIWNSVYQHQLFISKTYSKGSSANNHLIGEMAGLFIASVIWPVFPNSKRWEKLALDILEKELELQTYPDGINKEMGFSYQIFVLEFILLATLCKPKVFSDKWKQLVLRKINYANQLIEILGFAPNYGDGDEGMALQIVSLKSGRMAWINHIFETLFKEDTLIHPLYSEYSSSNYLLSKNAGLAAVRWRVKEDQFSSLIDFGPLGMGSMAAHGHADALSFVLAVNGKQFIVDPGTYCYHDNLEFRRYFRSTAAHNTVVVNQRDQSKQLGPFLWGEHAKCYLDDFSAVPFKLKAHHDGYMKNEGVKHSRLFECLNDGFYISDLIEGIGQKKVEVFFHFHPDIIVSIQENNIVGMTDSHVKLRMHVDDRMHVEIINGLEAGGWYSPFFGIKVPTTTLVLSQVLSLPTEIKTSIIK